MSSSNDPALQRQIEEMLKKQGNNYGSLKNLQARAAQLMQLAQKNPQAWAQILAKQTAAQSQQKKSNTAQDAAIQLMLDEDDQKQQQDAKNAQQDNQNKKSKLPNPLRMQPRPKGS